jgi:hypothetical protein
MCGHTFEPGRVVGDANQSEITHHQHSPHPAKIQVARSSLALNEATMNDISSNDIPTLLCKRTSLATVRIDRCPLCGKRHEHGIDRQLVAGKLSHRVAHCNRDLPPKEIRKAGVIEAWRESVSRGYYLQLIR